MKNKGRAFLKEFSRLCSSQSHALQIQKNSVRYEIILIMEKN